MSESNPFEAHWSAQGHNLCLGHWQIYYQGRPLSLPPAQTDKDMGTFGNFSYLFPDEPEWEEGLPEDEWILEHVDWLIALFVDNGIPADETHLRWFYQAVNLADWRCSSCGGCI